jgi:hypothetical protein
MNTLIFNQNYTESALRKHPETILTRFLNWTKEEEKNRIAWLGISITMMTAVFFPVTMVSILLHGASFRLIIGAMFSLILVVVPNMAALPTRYTIPAFFTGILIDTILIGASFFV